MKNYKITITFLVLLITNSVYAGDEITGMWSANERTRGGLAEQWIFKSDGVVEHSFGALVDFIYEIKGNKIRMELKNQDKENPASPLENSFSIKGDTLVVEGMAPGEEQKMKRTKKGKDSAHPITGEWTYKHNNGGSAFMRYSQNGTVQLSVPFTTMKGAYTVNGSNVDIKFPEEESKSLYFQRIKDQLTLAETAASPPKAYTLLEY